MSGHSDGSDAGAVSILVAGSEHRASFEAPFVFGRASGEGIVGLDPSDMGISAVAGSIELAWGVWWVVNQSSKRPLVLEHAEGVAHFKLAPGARQALTTPQLRVLVVGAVFTHVIDVVLPEDYTSELTGGAGRPTTGTLTGPNVSISDKERDALTALCAGFLRPFPHRSQHPLTYEEAARLLGPSWTTTTVRKATERVKDRYAKKAGVYFEGPQANYDLAGHLISEGILTMVDLNRITQQP